MSAARAQTPPASTGAPKEEPPYHTVNSCTARCSPVTKAGRHTQPFTCRHRPQTSRRSPEQPAVVTKITRERSTPCRGTPATPSANGVRRPGVTAGCTAAAATSRHDAVTGCHAPPLTSRSGVHVFPQGEGSRRQHTVSIDSAIDADAAPANQMPCTENGRRIARLEEPPPAATAADS